LREWNQLAAAHEHALTGIEYGRRFGVGSIWASSYVALMRVLQAQGDAEGALEALREAEATIQNHHVRLATRLEFNTSRVVQWLAVGDVEAASRWAQEFSGGSELEQIALARLRLAQGQSAQARHLLEEQGALARLGGRTGRLIEILGLQALALKAQGQPQEAGAALGQSLSLASSQGYLRVFLDLGDPLYDLLEMRAAQDPPAVTLSKDPVRSLLEAFQQERAEQQSRMAGSISPSPALAKGSIDTLTKRELEVLRLLARGLSNKEIAGELVVAPSTVKQHLKNIYGKLDVHSRTQAAARGRELELL
jgi:LuxR family maltose regulon positive regulatory protein